MRCIRFGPSFAESPSGCSFFVKFCTVHSPLVTKLQSFEMSQALEEKTKAELAKLQSDTAAPSSFVEEGAPDSFADLDAKLKAPSQLFINAS